MNKRLTDYLAAAVRWRRDLNLLPPEASIESADHIAGLAAECVCKVLLHRFGAMPAADGGLAERRLRVHLPAILDELLCIASGHSAVEIFARLPQTDPFRDWAIDDRYVVDGVITSAAYNAHRAALDQLFSSLQAAALDGAL